MDKRVNEHKFLHIALNLYPCRQPFDQINVASMSIIGARGFKMIECVTAWVQSACNPFTLKIHVTSLTALLLNNSGGPSVYDIQ